jgi:hypothetical protein
MNIDRVEEVTITMNNIRHEYVLEHVRIRAAYVSMML